MAIVGTDLLAYGAANHAEANGTTQGGVIDTTTKVVFVDIAATDSIKLQSTNAGDTMNCTITGRNAGGAIVSEVKALTGTTLTSATTASFERILKIQLASPAAGTVTVTRTTGGTTIATLEPGITSVRRLFYNVAAEAVGGSSRDFYEKIFLKNTHGTLTLTEAQVLENADPGGLITFDLEDAVNDNNSVATRLNTAPTGMLGTFTNTAKSVPGGGNLVASAAIGVWVKMTLPAGQAPAKNTWTCELTGNST